MLGEMVDGSQRKKKEKEEDMDELQNPNLGKNARDSCNKE